MILSSFLVPFFYRNLSLAKARRFHSVDDGNEQFNSVFCLSYSLFPTPYSLLPIPYSLTLSSHFKLGAKSELLQYKIEKQQFQSK
jgi:hypothetical protein